MAKKKYIQLPRGYLSYSQITQWQSDPEIYVKLYMDGRDELRTTNYGQEFGRKVADALEKGEETGDLVTDAALVLFPKYDVADQEMETEMKTPHGWIKIRFRPDTFNSKTHEFRENKTGKWPWTEKRAQEHLQMRVYATCIYLKFKTFLPEAWLDWMETAQNGAVPEPTGRVEHFRVTFTMKDILNTMTLISKVAKEIEIRYAHHVTDPRIANY